MNTFKGDGKDSSLLFSWTDVGTAPARLPVYSAKRDERSQYVNSKGSESTGGTPAEPQKLAVGERLRATRTKPHNRSGEELTSPSRSKESQVLSTYMGGGKIGIWPLSVYGVDVFSDLSALLPQTRALEMSEQAECADTPTPASLHPEDYSAMRPLGSLSMRSDDSSKEEWKLPLLIPRGDMVTKHASVSHWIEGTTILNEYALLKSVGKGTSGKVRLAYSLSRNESVAIKVIPRPREKRRAIGTACNSATARMEALQREIRVMKQLRHKSIVSLFEVIDDPDTEKLYIVMQYIDNGPIARLDREGNCDPIPPEDLTNYARQILAGMEYLQRHGIVHRDIKPENILVNSKKCAFISDFGVAAILGGDDEMCLHRFEGTPLFMPPEVFCSVDPSPCVGDVGADGTNNANSVHNGRGGKSDVRKQLLFAMDVWSLGVTFYTLLVGSVPFKTIGDIQNTLQSPVVIPDVVPEPWRLILQWMLSPLPEHRPTVSELRLRVKKMIRQDVAKQRSEVMNSSASQKCPGGCSAPTSPLPFDLHRPAPAAGPPSAWQCKSWGHPVTREHIVERAPMANNTPYDSLISYSEANASPAGEGCLQVQESTYHARRWNPTIA
ncbi:protein kinase, putative [Trypanosoma brucei gambiense DAL972]|uniref:Protein kinase, putative n=1 Tax=Trypanosoma brucei gambiense (strain MHOM/CI/86/DAL972) TaxID=679716 RepID=D0A7M2_TRYB9|nr:protein kinase, putative [Trypanosoma brucei gambiense DAL972]CBH17673.1 protein kinase, putative [Trypanosoma brucei gambiense DAL972]|eukprot:XP_011779937.1 protein kinase, putative [Trypanosoma brucei gambiense DAL972]